MTDDHTHSPAPSEPDTDRDGGRTPDPLPRAEVRKLEPAARGLPPLLRGLARRIEPYEIWLVLAAALCLLVPGIWAYSLIDPWETHYAEVARRMLQDSDAVMLRWQNEVFQSKPVLTFWLIAGGLSATGVGDGGGYSGELAESGWVMFAVRIPFVLFAIGGLVTTWWMLARLVSRRVAWLSFLVIGTTPFFFLVARQSITDMPMAACLMGAVACFAMAIHAGEETVQPVFRRVNTYHVFVGILLLVTGIQAIYYLGYFFQTPLARGLRIPVPYILLPAALWMGTWAFVLWSYQDGRATRRSVYLYWFYALVGISILGKGPVAIFLAGAICFFYLLLTGDWKLLRKLEIPRGLLVAAVIATPWHLAMWFKAGRPWANEYFVHHMWKRMFSGVHGDRGTFAYTASQLGIGFWPWAALLPAALATALTTARVTDPRGRVKLLVAIWAIAGFTLFAASKTKFHHYVLPAVPAMGILVAFWLDDVIAGRARQLGLLCLAGVGIVALICRDLIGEQEQLIELFIYRYDRPWPSGPPWNVDLGGSLLVFGVLFSLALTAFLWRRIRVYAVVGFGLVALVFAYWAMNSYMAAAAPHWGQRALHRTYYKERQIHGVEIHYSSLRDFADDWGADKDYRVKTTLPTEFAIGQEAKATIHLPAKHLSEIGVTLEDNTLVLTGTVTRLGNSRFWMTAAPAPDQADSFATLVTEGRKYSRSRRPPGIHVDADRLVAWQLNWRGENFWSGGEIYGRTKDTRTVFMKTDNVEFLRYVKEPSRKGRTFYVITEAGRASGLKGVLPTDTAKQTVKVLDTSCNKFTLLRFTL